MAVLFNVIALLLFKLLKLLISSNAVAEAFGVSVIDEELRVPLPKPLALVTLKAPFVILVAPV